MPPLSLPFKSSLSFWTGLLISLMVSGCAPAQTPAPFVEATPRQTPLGTAIPPTALPAFTPTSPPVAVLTDVPTVPPPRATDTSNISPIPSPATSQADSLSLTSQGDTLSLPGVSSPAPGGSPGIPCTVASDGLNVREGPGIAYAQISRLASGVIVSARKCLPGAEWLLVETPDQAVGWVSSANLNCQDDPKTLPTASGIVPPTTAPVGQAPATPAPAVSTEPVQPTATIAPAAPALPTPSTDVWRGEYYDNPNLGGEPVLVRQDPNLDFNWFLDSPGPGIPADNFSARWTRLVEFGEDGDYQFFASVDDGVRLYVDGVQVIGDWVDNGKADYFGYFTGLKAGLHTVVVEYFESGGFASIKVWSNKASLPENRWRAEYFSNADWRDPVTLVREDAEIDFDWGRDAPVFGLPESDFSVRWRRRLFLEPGDYYFFADIADRDRVKIYLDDWLLVDEAEESGDTIEGFFGNVGPGYHTITVEYRDEGGEAEIKFWWERRT